MTVIRQETGADHDAIRRVHDEAFGKRSEGRLVARIRASDRFVPSLSLVAEEDGEVVGHVLLSHVDLNGGRVLQLAPTVSYPPAFDEVR